MRCLMLPVMLKSRIDVYCLAYFFLSEIHCVDRGMSMFKVYCLFFTVMQKKIFFWSSDFVGDVYSPRWRCSKSLISLSRENANQTSIDLGQALQEK